MILICLLVLYVCYQNKDRQKKGCTIMVVFLSENITVNKQIVINFKKKHNIYTRESNLLCNKLI